jgi:hypothetical protein
MEDEHNTKNEAGAMEPSPQTDVPPVQAPIAAPAKLDANGPESPEPTHPPCASRNRRAAALKLFKDYWQIAASVPLGALILAALTLTTAFHHLAPIKISSLLVTALFSLLYHWQKPHDSKTNKLTPWGKWVYCLLVLSALTTLGAFIAEQRQSAETNAISRAATERQITNIIEVLSGVKAQQALAQTQAALMQTVLSSVQSQQIQTAKIVTNLGTQATVAAQTIAQIERLVSPLPPPQLELEFIIQSTASALAAINMAPGQAPTSQASNVQPSGVDRILTNPVVTLRAYADSNTIPTYATPDLYARFPNLSAAPQFDLVEGGSGVRCKWQFSVFPRDFHTTAKLFSLPDIANSKIRVDVTNSTPACAGSMRPVRLKLTFDTISVTITKFVELPTTPSPRLSLTQDELAAMPPGSQTPTASLEDADYNPDAIVAFGATVPPLKQIRAQSERTTLYIPRPPSGLTIIGHN